MITCIRETQTAHARRFLADKALIGTVLKFFFVCFSVLSTPN